MVHATMTHKASPFHYFLLYWVLHLVSSSDLLSCCSPTTIPHPGVFLLPAAAPEEGVIIKLCCFDNFISVFSLGLSFLAVPCVALQDQEQDWDQEQAGSGHGRVQVDVPRRVSASVFWKVEMVLAALGGVQAGLGVSQGGCECCGISGPGWRGINVLLQFWRGTLRSL